MSKLLSAREGLFCRPRAILLALLLVSILTLGPTGRAAAPPPQGEAESAEDEDIIVVTATRLPQPASEVPAAVTVVTAEEALAAGATTVAEAIRLAPTAVVNAHGGLGSAATVNLQGASSNQVQILVDGRPITTALGPVDLSSLPLSGVERIEVVQGPVSAVYGANALGGVVNVITRRPTKQRQSLWEFSVGGFGTRRLAWSGGDTLGWGSYLVTASTETSEGWRPNSAATLHALTTKLAWTTEGGEAVLGTRYTSAAAGSPGGDGTYPFLDPTPHARRGDESFHLDLAYRGDGPHQLETRIYYTNVASSYDDPERSERSRHHGVFGGAEARRTWEVGTQRILLGGEYRWDRGTSTNFQGDRTATNLGLYVEDLYEAGPFWSISLGGRMDAHSAYGQVVSPRLGAVRRLDKNKRLWFSLARAFRAPSFEDLYWDDPVWMMYGNPDLRPEVGTAFQAGFTWSGLEISAFRKDVRDNIAWVWNPETSETRAANLNSTRFEGLELSWRRPLGRWVTAEAAYTRLNAVNADTGKHLPKRPTDQGSLKLTVAVPGGWDGSVTVRTVGNCYYDEANAIVAPGFTKVDLALSRTVSPSLTWRVNLDNALNARYQEVPGYPMPGASLSTSVTYRF